MIKTIIERGFGKAMIIAVMIGVVINAYLCYERKNLQAENHAQRTEIALIRADNQNLANQLEHAQAHILQYQKQVERLHNQVIEKIQAAEERTNEILSELEKNQNWSNQSVPDGVSRLLNKRTTQSSKAQSATLPEKPAMPHSQSQH